MTIEGARGWRSAIDVLTSCCMVVTPMRHDTAPNGKALSPRDEQKRLTRRRLIEGALAAFEQKGYAATTIDDIVAEANASRATFYLHFKSKADVVLVMTE